MKIITGTVLEGRIVVEGERLTEGEHVTVLRREGNETFQVSPEEKRILLDSIAQADRGEFVDVNELLNEIDALNSAVGLFIKPTPAAAAQMRKESRWWRKNRPKAPRLFREELRRAFDLISAYPEAGAFSEDTDLADVRRILLPATQHYLYYRVKRIEQSIEILALWSTHRGDRPTF